MTVTKDHAQMTAAREPVLAGVPMRETESCDESEAVEA